MSVNGILFVDKAEGWTSHDVVAKARRSLGTRKIGHAGTLDPMATGLLTLGVGPSTRLLTHLVGLDKTYTATIRLGAATVTDDREGEVLARADAARVQAVTESDIRSGVQTLTGDILQVPSQVSAVKVDGKRAYQRVRDGEAVELAARPVTIHGFDLQAIRPGTADGQAIIDVDVTVHCSSGTYIRALARDLGDDLGIGGHLTALRRVAVGPFGFEMPERGLPSVTTDELAAGRGAEHLVAPADVARAILPEIVLTQEQSIDLGHGKRLIVEAENTSLAAATAPGGELIGLVSVSNGKTRVVTNFPTPDAKGGRT